MRLTSTLLTAGMMMMLNHAVALADPLAASPVPDDTRWVLHADIDAGKASPLWDLARKLFEPRKADLAPRLALLERFTGMRPGDDLKDVTLYGNAYDEGAVCIRIHGIMDKETITTLFKADPEYKEIPHGTHTIIAWRDKGRDRLMYASFTEGDLAFLSPSVKVIETALDTTDKKAPRLSASSPLLPQVTPGHPGKPIFWMAGDHLSDLPRKGMTESPMLSQMDAASIGLGWVNDKASIDLHIVAKTDKAAQAIQAVGEGIKGVAFLAAADEHAAPGAKLLGSAFSQLTMTTEAREVRGDWSISIDRIEAVLDLLPHDDVTIPAAKPAAATDRRP